MVFRYYLKGPKKGKWDVFVSNLPGTVDNLTPSKKHNGYWAALPMVLPTVLLDYSPQQSWLQSIMAKVYCVVVQAMVYLTLTNKKINGIDY